MPSKKKYTEEEIKAFQEYVKTEEGKKNLKEFSQKVEALLKIVNTEDLIEKRRLLKELDPLFKDQKP